jgi:hypothetical protein
MFLHGASSSHCFENHCAEGTLEYGGLTPPSFRGSFGAPGWRNDLGSLVGMNLGTARRRQAAALQGASRIFMHCGEPKDHEIFARFEEVDNFLC